MPRFSQIGFELRGADPQVSDPQHGISSIIDPSSSAPIFNFHTGTTGIPFTTIFKGNAGYDNTVRIASTVDSSISNFLELGYRSGASSNYFLQPSSTSSSSSIPDLLLSSGGSTATSLLLKTNGDGILSSPTTLSLFGGIGGLNLSANQGVGGNLTSNLNAIWSGTQNFTGSQFTISNSIADSGFLVQAATTITKAVQITDLLTASRGIVIKGTAGISTVGNIPTVLTGTLNVAQAVTFQNALTLLGPATLGSSLTLTNSASIGGNLIVQGTTGLQLPQGSLQVAGSGTFGAMMTISNGGLLVQNGASTNLSGYVQIGGSLDVSLGARVLGTAGLLISQGPLSVSGLITANSSLSVATGLSVLANGITTSGNLTQTGGATSLSGGDLTVQTGNVKVVTGNLQILGSAASKIEITNGYLQVGSYANIGTNLTVGSSFGVNGGATIGGNLLVSSLSSATQLNGTLTVTNNTTLNGLLNVSGNTVLGTNLTVTKSVTVGNADGTLSIFNNPVSIMSGALTVGSVANKVYLYSDGSPAKIDTGLNVNNNPLNVSSGAAFTGNNTFSIASTVATSILGTASFGSAGTVTFGSGFTVSSGAVNFASSSGISISNGNVTVASTSNVTLNGSLTTNSTLSAAGGLSATGTVIGDILTARTKIQNLSGTFVVDNSGQMSSFNLTTGIATVSSLTSNTSVTATSFKNVSNSFTVGSNGAVVSTLSVTSPTFSNTAGSFLVDSNGNVTASSIIVPAINTTSGIYTDYVKAKTFLNSDSSFTVDATGIVTASAAVIPSLKNATTNPTYQQDSAGNVSVTTLTSSGLITGTSGNFSGNLISASLQNTDGSISIGSGGILTFKTIRNAVTSPTIYSDTTGKLFVNALSITNAVTGSSASWTNGVTSASFTSTSGSTTIDNAGNISTTKLVAPTLTQALMNPTWNISSAGAATFSGQLIGNSIANSTSTPTFTVSSGGAVVAASLITPSLQQATSSPTWSIASNGNGTFAALSASSLNLNGGAVTNGSIATFSGALNAGNLVLSGSIAGATSGSFSGGLSSSSWTGSNASISAAGLLTAVSAIVPSITQSSSTPTWQVLANGNSSFNTVTSLGSIKAATIQNTNGSFSVDSAGNALMNSVVASTHTNAASNPTFSADSSGNVLSTTLTSTGQIKSNTSIATGSVTIAPAPSSNTYTFQLPQSLPTGASLLQVSSTGIISYGNAIPSSITFTTATLPVTTPANVTNLIMSQAYTRASVQVATSNGNIARYILESYYMSSNSTWYLTASAQGMVNLGIAFTIIGGSGQVQYAMNSSFGTSATFIITQN